MVCEDCYDIVVLHAFSESNCIKCNEEIITSHIPSYIICKKCSQKYKLCEQCGKPIKKYVLLDVKK